MTTIPGLAFLDLETSGLDPMVHDIMEVGLIMRRVPPPPDGWTETEIEFSLPFDPTKATPRALEVNGWGRRQFAPLQDIIWAAEFLHTVLEDWLIVGNNVQFDVAFLRELLRKHGLTPSWNHRLVELKPLAGGALGLAPPWSTDDLCRRLGVDPPDEDAHTALGDARWNKRFYDSLHLLPTDQR